MYISDRTRAEISLPAQMMFAAFLAGLPEETLKSEDFLALKKDLVDACTESVDDLPDKHKFKILDRVKRIHARMTTEIVKEDVEVGKVGLIIFHLMRFIIDAEYLVYSEDSAFHRCIVTFMDALEHHAQEEKVNASAIKQAKKMLKRLQYEENLYIGVDPDGTL